MRSIRARRTCIRLSMKLWMSIDGERWCRVDPSPVPEKYRIADVVAVDGGFLVVAADQNELVAWVSEDGRTWRQIPSAPAADATLIRPEQEWSPDLGVFVVASDKGNR